MREIRKFKIFNKKMKKMMIIHKKLFILNILMMKLLKNLYNFEKKIFKAIFRFIN